MFFLIGFLVSCSDNNETIYTEKTDLQGEWLLVEQYADPGDGSGGFEKVSSEKTIQFFSDGSYVAEGSLCTMSIEGGSETSGTYTVINELSTYSSNNYVVPNNCDFEDYKVFLHFEGSSLILSYLCIEGCAQKYSKQ